MKTIRKATAMDVEAADKIYDGARKFMHENGNPNQWTGGYPSINVINEDINNDRLFICEENGDILGVFCFFEGEDPTYRVIEDGSWLNDEPYGVIHRIAVADIGRGRGVASFCFDYAFGKCKNVRIDTHRDNLPMQKSLIKNGFLRCGIIYLENGDERIAFQRID